MKHTSVEYHQPWIYGLQVGGGLEVFRRVRNSGTERSCNGHFIGISAVLVEWKPGNHRTKKAPKRHPRLEAPMWVAIGSCFWCNLEPFGAPWRKKCLRDKSSSWNKIHDRWGCIRERTVAFWAWFTKKWMVRVFWNRGWRFTQGFTKYQKYQSTASFFTNQKTLKQAMATQQMGHWNVPYAFVSGFPDRWWSCQWLQILMWRWSC